MTPRTCGTAPGGGLLSAVDALLRLAVQLVWLNLWWTLLTLRGGIVFGLGPASVGAHAVTSAWARGERGVDIRDTMCAHSRAHRRSASAAGLLSAALIASLAATWCLSRSQPPIPAAITQGLVLLAALLLTTTLPYLPLVIERTAADAAPPVQLSRLFAAGLALGMARPVLSFAVMVIWLGWPLLLLASGWPGLFPVLGVSVPFAASAWCLERALPGIAAPALDLPSAHDPAPNSIHTPERTP